MTSIPHRPPPCPAIAATLDGAEGLAVPTATGYAFQIDGQHTWTLCDRWNPNLLLLGPRRPGRQGPQRQGGGRMSQRSLPPIFELERPLWAFQGIDEILNPDQVLDSQERSHLSTLVELLAERLESVHHAIVTQHTALLAELAQARASQAPTPSPEIAQPGGPHD